MRHFHQICILHVILIKQSLSHFMPFFNVMFQVIHILDKISKNVKNSELID